MFGKFVRFFKSFKIYWEVSKCRFETLVFFIKVFFKKEIFEDTGRFSDLIYIDLSWHLYGKSVLSKKQVSVHLR